jgi:RND family efflux transporter MFP subunit
VPGTVEAARVASLASRIPATIQKVAVEEGARVRKGDLLVRLDGRDLSANVEAAEAQLAAARAQRDRIRSLFDKQAATRQELEAVEAADAAADAAVKAARAQFDYVEIRAPFDGLVAARRMQAGDLAAPGREILSLHGIGLMRVAATVPQEQALRLAAGQSLDAILESGVHAACAVSVLGPAGDAASRRFLVKCDLPGSAAARAGSFARLMIPSAPLEPLTGVPEEALIERGGLTGIFVVEEGVARLRWISPGESRGGAVIVRAGLAPGEEVILDPGGLIDGAPVHASPTEKSP